MKQNYKRKKVAFICMTIAMIAMVFSGIDFTRIKAETICDADVTTASTGCTMLGIKGDYLMDTEAALAYINQIRYEACENGYKDPRNTSRNLTLSDYKPIQWSQALERIARLRAAESSMTMFHARLNGQAITSIKYGGISLSGECLAWHGGDDVIYGITQWYTEKKYWTSEESGVTGHYEALINPNYAYIGLGNFFCEETHYGSTLAGEFSSSCGSFGTTPLETQKNVIQKVEVKDDYITPIVDCEDVIGRGTTQSLAPKAMVAYSGGYKTKIDYLYNSYTYKSSNTSVATVSSTGEITGVTEGTTTITISSGGTTIATKEVIIGCPHDYEYTGSGFTYSKKCKLCGDTGDYPQFNYYVFGNNSSTTSFGGFRVQDWSVGDEYYVWPAYQDPANNNRTISKKVYVTSSNESVMSVTKNGYDNMYKMKFLKPGIVKLNVNPKEDPKLASTYTIRVQGDSTVDIADAEVQMPEQTYIYDGTEKKPVPVVSFDGISLVNGTDYTVSYENNIEAGIGSVVITGKGIFSGTKKVNFVIEKAKEPDTDSSAQGNGDSTSNNGSQSDIVNNQGNRNDSIIGTQNDVANNQENKNESTTDGQNVPAKVGTNIIATTGKYVVSSSSKKEVTFTAPANSTVKTVTIPDVVTCNGVKYKVTKIKTNAMKGKKKVTKITIGKNVKYIEKNAFSGCDKLKSIIVKSKKLTSKSVAKKAFSSVKKSTKITVSKSKLASYKKLFRKKGLSKKVKVKA